MEPPEDRKGLEWHGPTSITKRQIINVMYIIMEIPFTSLLSLSLPPVTQGRESEVNDDREWRGTDGTRNDEEERNLLISVFSIIIYFSIFMNLFWIRHEGNRKYQNKFIHIIIIIISSLWDGSGYIILSFLIPHGNRSQPTIWWRNIRWK